MCVSVQGEFILQTNDKVPLSMQQLGLQFHHRKDAGTERCH